MSLVLCFTLTICAYLFPVCVTTLAVYVASCVERILSLYISRHQPRSAASGGDCTLHGELNGVTTFTIRVQKC